MCASVPVTTTAVIRPSTDTWATRQASVAASAAWTSSSAAGSPTRPPPSPYQLWSRMWSRSRSSRRASAEWGDGSAACRTRSSVSSAASGCVGRRAHRRDPADQRAGAFGPLEGERGRAVLESQSHALQRQRPAVAHEGALEVEAAERRLPGVQVVQPRAYLGARGVPVAAGLLEVGAHLVPQQPGLHGGVVVDGHAVEAPLGVGEVASPQGEPGGLELQQGRVAVVAVTVQLGRHLVGTAQQRGGLARPTDLGEQRDGVGAQRRDRAAEPAIAPRRPPGDRAGAPVSARSKVRASASSHSAWKRRSRREPYAVAASSRATLASRARPAAVSTSARSCSPTARDTADSGASTCRAVSIICSAPTRSPVSSRA